MLTNYLVTVTSNETNSLHVRDVIKTNEQIGCFRTPSYEVR
jgi:hypothetical protein